MKSINQKLLKNLSPSTLVFQSSSDKEFIKKSDCEKNEYMFLRIDENGAVLSTKIAFSHEAKEHVVLIPTEEILNGTWWIL